ncbi:hypothetical protein ACN28C_13680 [Plantactinospora sp. WMMC1484]|uniref:hypothetical protein n=1 Tax=Plantactinospora sp. WMMC1484 TaxID=3404122 RepID=UPI003BF46343
MSDFDPVLMHHSVDALGRRDLRPLQRAAMAPLLAGDDALLRRVSTDPEVEIVDTDPVAFVVR